MKSELLPAAVHGLRAAIRVLRVALRTAPRNTVAHAALLRLDKAADDFAKAVGGGGHTDEG